MSKYNTTNIELLLQGYFTSSTVSKSVVKNISSGLTANVHLVKCPQFTGRPDNLLVLKIFNNCHLNTVYDEVDVYRKILKHIDHDFIVKAYGYAAKPNAYSVMYFEYISNGTLIQYINEHPQIRSSTYYLIFTLAEISEGLDMLHDIGIVHNDIKSDNILIRENGHLAICDFGVSMASKHKRGVVKHSIFGCSVHLAPEVSNRNVLFIDCSVDYYSLGVLICDIVDHNMIPNPRSDNYDYSCPTTFMFIPHIIRNTVAALMHPNNQQRLCNDNKGNISLLLEPGMKSVLWSKFDGNISVHEIKHKIREQLLDSPFK